MADFSPYPTAVMSLFVLGRCGHYTKPLQDSLDLDNVAPAQGFSMRVRRYRPCPLDMCLKFDIFLGRIYLLLLIECLRLREMDALETRSAAALRPSRRLLYSTDNSL
jgi:hypothetical protein